MHVHPQWRFTVFYGPVWLVALIASVFYVKVDTYSHAHTHAPNHPHTHAPAHARLNTRTFVRFHTCTCTQVRVAVTRYSSFSRGTPQQARLIKMARQLSLYPLIFIISWTPITIVRIYNCIAPEQPLFWLTLIQVVFSPMSWQAALNTIA